MTMTDRIAAYHADLETEFRTIAEEYRKARSEGDLETLRACSDRMKPLYREISEVREAIRLRESRAGVVEVEASGAA